jgi:hypothetical protein
MLKIVIEELTSRVENCDIQFSGMLSYVNWWLVTDVSAQRRALYSRVKQSFKAGTYRLSRNGGD